MANGTEWRLSGQTCAIPHPIIIQHVFIYGLPYVEEFEGIWKGCSFTKFHQAFMFVSVWRDGQSGKLTVDDYGAKTGRSPGKMRQLNINGDLYIGKKQHKLILMIKV